MIEKKKHRKTMKIQVFNHVEPPLVPQPATWSRLRPAAATEPISTQLAAASPGPKGFQPRCNVTSRSSLDLNIALANGLLTNSKLDWLDFSSIGQWIVSN